MSKEVECCGQRAFVAGVSLSCDMSQELAQIVDVRSGSRQQLVAVATRKTTGIASWRSCFATEGDDVDLKKKFTSMYSKIRARFYIM